MPSRFFRTFVNPFRRDSLEREVEEEFSFHLEQKERDLIDAGVDPSEARRRARAEFGPVGQWRRESVKMRQTGRKRGRRIEWRNSWMQDLRHAVRGLARNPTLTVAAVSTLALGIGANTAIYSVAHAVIFRPLPYPEPDRLVAIWLRERGDDGETADRGFAFGDFVDYRDRSSTLVDMAFMSYFAADFHGERPVRVIGQRVPASYFDLLGVRAARGRTLIKEDADRPESDRAVVLTHAVWTSHFGADPEVVGRTFRTTTQGRSGFFTVVGVLPEDFEQAPGFRFDSQVGLTRGVVDLFTGSMTDPVVRTRRGGGGWSVYARIAEGRSLEEARTEMRSISAGLAEAYPETNEGVGVWVQRYTSRMGGGPIRTVLWVMLGAVFGVLMIACFNVANLLLARSLVRSKEVAVRSALGADRGRLMRQFLIEAGVLVALGGAVGVVIAYYGIAAFNASIADIQKPYWIVIRLDGAAVLFTIGITAVASLVAGTLPAVRASGGQIHDILKDESRGSSSLRMGRFSTGLVIGEIALSSALLVAAGMMVKSVINLNTVDMGFEGEHVFTARLGLFESDYPDDEARVRFYDRLVEDLNAEPGVEAAGLTTNLPARPGARVPVALEGVAYADVTDQALASRNNITPGYFDALSVAVVEGRGFGPQDRAGAMPTVIVNESFARRHFEAETPIGRRFRTGEEQPWMTIVGLVPDIFIASQGPGGADVPPDQFFVPIAQQQNLRFVSITVKTRGEPGAFAADAREVVARIDPDLPLYWVLTMEESLETATFIYTIFGSLFTTFGLAALFLAAVGLYGVMAFSVSRRTQEMGVRMAMGAGAGDVMWLILGKGMKQLAIGGVAGLLMGAALVRPLAVVFFDVDPSDPTVYAAIVVTLGLAGLVACLVPARRATRIELVEALRPD
ncbi:MAG: ABC transporter permease [Gemmatimonadetes bacterium]|nr:ABC transporter permease [Gemmatimonadota bacterium]